MSMQIKITKIYIRHNRNELIFWKNCTQLSIWTEIIIINYINSCHVKKPIVSLRILCPLMLVETGIGASCFHQSLKKQWKTNGSPTILQYVKRYKHHQLQCPMCSHCMTVNVNLTQHITITPLCYTVFVICIHYYKII